MPNELKPRQETGPFEPGAPLQPATALRTWLAGQSRLLRLPLVLSRGPTGFDLARARIGAAEDALEVAVNDSALGVGLADRARMRGESTCAFWVEGYWAERSLAGGPALDVTHAEPLGTLELAAVTHVQVQGERGN